MVVRTPSHDGCSRCHSTGQDVGKGATSAATAPSSEQPLGRPSSPAAPLGRLPPGRGRMSGGSHHEGPIHSLLGASGPSSSGSRSRSSEPLPPSPSPTPFPAHEGPGRGHRLAAQAPEGEGEAPAWG